LRAVGFFIDKGYGRAADDVALRVEHTPLNAGAILSKRGKSNNEKREKKKTQTQTQLYAILATWPSPRDLPV
jgi:hypothetical protein